MGRDQRDGGGGDASPAWSTHPPERSQHRMTPRRQGPGGSDFAADAASKSERGLFGPEEHSPISHTQSLPSPLPPPCRLAWPSVGACADLASPRTGRLPSGNAPCSLGAAKSHVLSARVLQTDRQTACFMSALHFSRGFSGAKGNSSGLPSGGKLVDGCPAPSPATENLSEMPTLRNTRLYLGRSRHGQPHRGLFPNPPLSLPTFPPPQGPRMTALGVYLCLQLPLAPTI